VRDAPAADTPCHDALCELVAVVTDDDGVPWCIVHAPTPEGYEGFDPADEVIFNEHASTTLAAVLLMATADCLRENGAMVPETIGTIAAATGMPLDVATGILLVTTLIAVGGELSPETLEEAAARYGNLSDDEVAEVAVPDEADAPAVETNNESEA